MVVTKTFVWAHLPKTAGDTVAKVFALFPEIIEFADTTRKQVKHTPFRDRPELVAGRQRVLCIRRLPSWQLSYSAHKSRNGLYRTSYRPLPMETPQEMSDSTVADRHLSLYVEAGLAWPDRWIRVEHLVDDVLSLLEEHVEVTPKKREKIRAMKPRNRRGKHERSVSYWFSDEMVARMYERNPLWRHAEELAYSHSTGIALDDD